MEPVAALVASLLPSSSHAQIEAALTASFCDRHQLTPDPDSPVGRAVAAAPEGGPAATAVAGLDQLGLDELVQAFETLVPEAEADSFGAVFTPEAITSFMAREAVDRCADGGFDLDVLTVLDPAVGCGALLVAVLRELVVRTGQPASVVAGRLHGVDVSPDSVRRAELLIGLACLALGDRRQPQVQLAVADALRDEVFDSRRFPLVIANPPYVRYQQLDPEVRADLASRFDSCKEGNFNLYFPFFEVGHARLEDAGVLAYITPNGFFTSKSAGPLRRWLTASGLLDTVVDFGHHRVFEALTYTAVSFGRRRTGRHPLAYLDVAGLPGLAALPDRLGDAPATTVSVDDLEAPRWRLVGPDTKQTVDTIRATGTRLDQLAQVRYGLATLRDRLYLLDGERDPHGTLVARVGSESYPIEEAVTRRCVKVSKVRDAAALAAVRARVIYPYVTTPDGQVRVLDEDVLAARYPGAYRYLSAVRGELAQRDKGRKTYAAWFAYGRTQGLVPLGPKLLTPLYAATPRFLRDDTADSLFVNGCAVVPSDARQLDLLELVLNSGVCRLYIEATANAISGGFYAYQKTQLGGFGVPPLTSAEVAELAALPPRERDLALADVYGVVLPEAYLR